MEVVMEARKIGYARVSSKDQNENRQIDAFINAGLKLENIYIDRQSGKDFDRPMYSQMLKEIKCNDTLYILSIDRLGRNYEAIIGQWKLITRDIRADIVVLDMPLLDTRIAKDLLGTFISDLVLQILSFVAESERDNIKNRQRAGIDAAKKRGVIFGRPKSPVPYNFEYACNLLKLHKCSVSEAAVICNMAKTTFYNKAKQAGKL